jgi:TolA-binding protein
VNLRAGDTECRGDLVARAQRGPLSAADRSALIAHLSSCESCRLIQQVASDFAEMRAVDRGDELRLEEMAALARRAVRWGARVAGPGRRRWYARAAAAAAGLLLIVGSASATVWLWPRLIARPSAPSAPAPTLAAESPRRVPARNSAASTPTVPPAAEAPAILPAAPAPAVAMSAPTRSRSPRERPAIRATAGELLRQARDAKTDGRGPQAIALYRHLQNEFPASSEALVAAVPLGRLLLDRSSPRAALAEFDRYLGGAAGGALVPEALYGRAQAQARLGDHDAERASWRRLLADYPDSPYSALARRRLTELQ